MLRKIFNLSIILSGFLFDDILFNPKLFISSISLKCGNIILYYKNSNFLSFCSIYISISSVVSPIIFIACSKTLLWIKAFCPNSIVSNIFLCSIFQRFVKFRFIS